MSFLVRCKKRRPPQQEGDASQHVGKRFRGLGEQKGEGEGEGEGSGREWLESLTKKCLKCR